MQVPRRRDNSSHLTNLAILGRAHSNPLRTPRSCENAAIPSNGRDKLREKQQYLLQAIRAGHCAASEELKGMVANVEVGRRGATLLLQQTQQQRHIVLASGKELCIHRAFPLALLPRYATDVNDAVETCGGRGRPTVGSTRSL